MAIIVWVPQASSQKRGGGDKVEVGEGPTGAKPLAWGRSGRRGEIRERQRGGGGGGGGGRGEAASQPGSAARSENFLMSP